MFNICRALVPFIVGGCEIYWIKPYKTIIKIEFCKSRQVQLTPTFPFNDRISLLYVFYIKPGVHNFVTPFYLKLMPEIVYKRQHITYAPDNQKLLNKILPCRQSSGSSSPLCFMQMRVGGSVKPQLSYDRDLLVWRWLYVSALLGHLQVIGCFTINNKSRSHESCVLTDPLTFISMSPIKLSHSSGIPEFTRTTVSMCQQDTLL